MNLAADLLVAAGERDLAQLDEKLFFDTFPMPKGAGAERDTTSRARRSRS